ncbi:hypothetical protein [Streptomyces sp. NPDC127197]|uniref:MmyB family transcriptional regulator n=1 Tax=Streptomyces sp. NPDC127197 TaxID=3345388 RepID=UPI0036382DA9
MAAVLLGEVTPAFIANHRQDVIGSNRLARALITDFDALPYRERNFARYVLLDPVARDRYDNWDEVEATGVVPPGGGKVSFEIDKEDPKNSTGNRFTMNRSEKSLNVTLNSVVFRSGGQDLTTTGGYIEMTSRFSEPILLGLAALAIRGRVKR